MLVENGEHEGQKTKGPIEKMVKVRCGGDEGDYKGFDEAKVKGLERVRKPVEGREGSE
jgi:hypothetical protein